jgi:hypothetical protein
MDEEMPDGAGPEEEAREWLGKIYDEAKGGTEKERALSTTEIDELLTEDLRDGITCLSADYADFHRL